jgi:sugar/nucleoside kinase (ribokinase family)
MSGPGRVIVIGDIVTDVVTVLGAPIVAGSDTPAHISVTGGGAGANTAAWLADAGLSVTMCGVVGADTVGSGRIAELSAVGVACVIRQSPEMPTGSIVVLAGPADRAMITDRGANALLTPADVDAAFADSADAVHLHLSGYSLLDAGSADAARHALEVAHARGLTVSVDAASAVPLREVGGLAFVSWVRRADVLFANGDEARVLLGEADSQRLLATGLAAALATRLDGRADVGGTVVVKLGADGAVAATSRGAVVEAPALPVNAVDATGAGDAFAAGFLTAWLGGDALDEALATGAAFGARAVTTMGARPPVARSHSLD